MSTATKASAAIDRLSEDDIGRLVDYFYANIRADAELGPVFARAIPGDWAPHDEAASEKAVEYASEAIK